MKSRRLGGVVLALLMFSGCVSLAAIESDQLLDRLQPQAYISDFAGVLAPEERAGLEKTLAEFERQTSIEIAVVTVTTLAGGQVDDFTNRLFNRWGVGKKGANNGVMILAAIQDRKARIEVGYGLEGKLPDAAAGRILREKMFPPFKQGRYAEGLAGTVRALTQILAGNTAAPAVTPTPSAERAPGPGSWWLVAFWIGVLVLLTHAFYRMMMRLARVPAPGPWRQHRWDDSMWSGSSSGGFSGGGGFSSGGGFGGFGGGSSGGGGASGSW